LGRVDNFKRAGGTFEISRLLYNAPTAHTHILILNRPQHLTFSFLNIFLINNVIPYWDDKHEKPFSPRKE
jgi:hypothetical protein